MDLALAGSEGLAELEVELALAAIAPEAVDRCVVRAVYSPVVVTVLGKPSHVVLDGLSSTY